MNVTQANLDTAQAVKDEIAERWQYQIRSFGMFSPVECYMTDPDATVVRGIANITARNNASTKFPTIWLNCRSWLALMMASTGMQVPAYFIVKFSDQIMWIDVAQVGGMRMIMAGRKDRGLANDIEPVFDIPIAAMNPLLAQ
jgi:hypothetical protein